MGQVSSIRQQMSALEKLSLKHQRISDSKLRALGKVQSTNKQKGMHMGSREPKPSSANPSALRNLRTVG